MAEARRAKEGLGSWGGRGEPPPDQLGVRGSAVKPILVHFQGCRRHKNSLYRGYPVVTFENLVTNSRYVFVCLIFP